MKKGAAAEQDEILRVEHLTMRFGGLVAVDGLSFSARRGDITAIIGPNGAGKTTVFNCITGFYKPTEGRIALAHGGAAAFEALPEITALEDNGARRRTARSSSSNACRASRSRAPRAWPAPSRTSGFSLA